MRAPARRARARRIARRATRRGQHPRPAARGSRRVAWMSASGSSCARQRRPRGRQSSVADRPTGAVRSTHRRARRPTDEVAGAGRRTASAVDQRGQRRRPGRSRRAGGRSRRRPTPAPGAQRREERLDRDLVVARAPTPAARRTSRRRRSSRRPPRPDDRRRSRRAARAPRASRPRRRRGRASRRWCRGCGSSAWATLPSASAQQRLDRGVRRPSREHGGVPGERTDPDPVASTATWSRPGSALMSTSIAGAASRMESSGIRLWPPASTLASGRRRRGPPTASSSDRGPAIRERRRFHAVDSPRSGQHDSRRGSSPVAELPAPRPVRPGGSSTITTIVPSAMPLEREVVGDLQRDVADADDDARGEADQVDRVAEVDPVLLPDLGAEQADHAVEHDGDAAEHAARGRADERAELRAQPEQDRDDGGDVVGGGGVDPGRAP